MGQVTKKLRRGTSFYTWFCQGCDEAHPLYDSWTFNGDLDHPTFSPSVRHSGMRAIEVNGEWTGEWVRDEQGKPVPFICHYFVRDGMIEYCSDSTHHLAGQTLEMPDLPDFLQDSKAPEDD